VHWRLRGHLHPGSNAKKIRTEPTKVRASSRDGVKREELTKRPLAGAQTSIDTGSETIAGEQKSVESIMRRNRLPDRNRSASAIGREQKENTRTRISGFSGEKTQSRQSLKAIPRYLQQGEKKRDSGKCALAVKRAHHSP